MQAGAKRKPAGAKRERIASPGRRQLRHPFLLPALAFFVLIVQVALSTQSGQAGDKADPQIAEQKKVAVANWKRAYEKDEVPPHLETENLVLYGKAPGMTLDELAPSLEKEFLLAKKTLGMEKPDLWAGKLTVFVLPERSDFSPFVRRVEKRRAEPEETGSIFIRTDQPHVVAAPPKAANDLSVDRQAGAQIATALLTRKAGELPYWLSIGFGRATVTQCLPQRDRYVEHQKALQMARKYTVQEAWAGNLGDADAAVLRGSIVEYLAYSGRTTRFMPLVSAFRPNENGDRPGTDAALKMAEIDGQRLHGLWVTWLKTGK